MRSILIVTEQFTLGGLETHIQGEIRQLSEQGVAAHLAVGNAFDSAFVPPCVVSVTSGLPLDPLANAGSLLEAIDQLRDIIRKHQIQAVHAHPFASFIPAAAAAELEAVPLVITLHGPASLTSYGPIYDVLVRDVIFRNAAFIVSVSPEVIDIASTYSKRENIIYIPNSVMFEENDGDCMGVGATDARWLVASRLDFDKIPGVIDFCAKARESGIVGVVVVGDGVAKRNLEGALAELGLSDYAELAGACSNLPELMRRYCGVAGMGRVLLEGVASKKPVVLVGYDGVKGVVDPALLQLAAKRNFSGRGLPTLDVASFSEQLYSNSMADVISDNFRAAKEVFNERISWKFFKERLSAARRVHTTAISGLYHALVEHPVNEDVPYLQSTGITERLARVVCGKSYYDARLVSALSLHLRCLEVERGSKEVAERDGLIANLNEAMVERQGEVAQLKQFIAAQDGQIAHLNEEIVEREGEIGSLSQAVVERDGQIAGLGKVLADGKHNYQKIMKSNSLKLDRALRTVRMRAETSRALVRAFYHVLISQGPRMALIYTRNWMLRRKTSNRSNAQDLKMSNQEIYLMNRSAQNEYVAKYIENGLDETHVSALAGVLLDSVPSERKIIVLPLSYPLELTQRPDHIMRFFAERDYLCIMLQVDDKPPSFREVAHNRYLTNVFAGVISLLASRSHVVLYLTYPFFGYLVDHMPRAKCLYDVLDDLSVFSLNCEAMLQDHRKLLMRASAIMFSSKELMKKNAHRSEVGSFLVRNGVWVNDFQGSKGSNALLDFGSNGFTVGYHGALSELLDWTLLERILTIPGVKIVLIGPLVEFDAYSKEALAVRNRVLSSSSVLHVNTVPYSELKGYLEKFSLGLVPFIINEKTNPVLPLKLFEYMAMGLPICATRTSTLLDYSGTVFVGTNEEIVYKIRAMACSTDKVTRLDYKASLADADWAVQVSPVADMLDLSFGIREDAEFFNPNNVDIVNINFFDWDGDVLYKGGAERYVFDLACLMRDLGWAPRIIQNANRDFFKDFRGIPVVGVKTDSGGDIKLMSKKFREVCKDSSLVIASPADLACNLFGLRVIGINHGVYWDHKFKRLEDSGVAEYKNIFDALRLAVRVVSVDTNFINWTRTYDYSMAGKLSFVPNYFDSMVFRPCWKEFGKKIRVLYPRRLYEARGIFITLKAFDYLFSKYPEVELHLVGQANEEDGRVVADFIDSHSGRVVWEEFDMDDMYSVYQQSHVVLVPTLYAEGTSLSCIEAMATNNALIATNIGGLPNLVIDGFNGFLINPTANDLVVAIESLLNDRALMRNMAAKGLEMSEVFEKSKWLTRWRKVISEVVQ